MSFLKIYNVNGKSGFIKSCPIGYKLFFSLFYINRKISGGIQECSMQFYKIKVALAYILHTDTHAIILVTHSKQSISFSLNKVINFADTRLKIANTMFCNLSNHDGVELPFGTSLCSTWFSNCVVSKGHNQYTKSSHFINLKIEHLHSVRGGKSRSKHNNWSLLTQYTHYPYRFHLVFIWQMFWICLASSYKRLHQWYSRLFHTYHWQRTRALNSSLGKMGHKKNWVQNDLPKLSPHSADDIKWNTNKMIANGKWPAIITVSTGFTFNGL